MSVSKVAIIGRPNVGKSSLFNWLSGRLISVVDPTAGVTRDRVEYLLHENDRYFELVDTGGLGIEDVDNLTEQIEYQIRIAIEQADLLLFVVNAQSGVVPLDLQVAERLRRIDKPKLLVVNKCDSTRTDAEVHEFHRLCEAPLIATSVKANRNRDELITAIVENLPPQSELEEAHGNELSADPELKLAIVGRRNVGKSTFINALAESERVIVSEIPGTTRDSVDIRFDVDGKRLLAIDTPGVRKRKSLATDVEFYGLVRAAQHPAGRRGVHVLRRERDDFARRHPTRRRDRQTEQALCLRRQQMGFGSRDDDRGLVGLPAADFRHDAIRSRRFPDRQGRA